MDWLIDYYNWRIVSQYAGQFAAGLANTLIAAGASLALSVLAGIPLALARMSPRAPCWRPVAGYVQFVRATPLLVQIYLVYYAVPMLIPGAKGWSEMALGIMAMTLHHAAYMSEIIRVGIESVPRGQVEGAKACGMNYGQRLRYVVLPQASPRCRRCAAGPDGGADQGHLAAVADHRVRAGGRRRADEQRAHRAQRELPDHRRGLSADLRRHAAAVARRQLVAGRPGLEREVSMLESYLSTAGVVLPFLLKGFWETLKISFFAIIAGSLLGFVIGVVRSYRIRGLHQLLGCTSTCCAARRS